MRADRDLHASASLVLLRTSARSSRVPARRWGGDVQAHTSGRAPPSLDVCFLARRMKEDRLFFDPAEPATGRTANVANRGACLRLPAVTTLRVCSSHGRVGKVKAGCRWRRTGTRTGAAGTCWKETASAKSPHASQISRSSWYRNAPSCWLRAPWAHTWWVQRKPGWGGRTRAACSCWLIRRPAGSPHATGNIAARWQGMETYLLPAGSTLPNVLLLWGRTSCLSVVRLIHCQCNATHLWSRLWSAFMWFVLL